MYQGGNFISNCLGANDPYKALRTALKAEIHADAWATLNSDTSRPFPKPPSGRIAVKVVNLRSDYAIRMAAGVRQVGFETDLRYLTPEGVSINIGRVAFVPMPEGIPRRIGSCTKSIKAASATCPLPFGYLTQLILSTTHNRTICKSSCPRRTDL